MMKLLLAVLGAWAAWRYRGPIKEYVNRQIPEVQKKATTVFGDAAEKFNAARRSSAERREGQA